MQALAATAPNSQERFEARRMLPGMATQLRKVHCCPCVQTLLCDWCCICLEVAADLNGSVGAECTLAVEPCMQQRGPFWQKLAGASLQSLLAPRWHFMMSSQHDSKPITAARYLQVSSAAPVAAALASGTASEATLSYLYGGSATEGVSELSMAIPVYEAIGRVRRFAAFQTAAQMTSCHQSLPVCVPILQLTINHSKAH